MTDRPESLPPPLNTGAPRPGNRTGKLPDPNLGPRRKFGPRSGPDHPGFGRKFPTGWSGTWGPIGDPRSKLFKLALKIERQELIPQYGRPDQIGAQGLMREAACWKALARMTLSTIGVNAASTPRKAASMTKMAKAIEGDLARLIGKVKSWQPASGQELMDYAARMAGGEMKNGGAP
jgi:hypothetical protein